MSRQLGASQRDGSEPGALSLAAAGGGRCPVWDTCGRGGGPRGGVPLSAGRRLARPGTRATSPHSRGRLPIVVPLRDMRSPCTSDGMGRSCRGQGDDNPPRGVTIQARTSCALRVARREPCRDRASSKDTCNLDKCPKITYLKAVRSMSDEPRPESPRGGLCTDSGAGHAIRRQAGARRAIQRMSAGVTG
jgi:hypothetical protein